MTVAGRNGVGATYNITVNAINGLGWGQDSEILRASPSVTGSAPTGLTVVPGPDGFALTWTAPDYSSDAVRPLLTGDYESHYNPTSPDEQTWSSVPVTGTTGAVSVTTYPKYYFKVVAVTSNGHSRFSSVVSAITQ